MWRPLTHEVTTAPFAFCDRRLVGPGHLIAADRVSRDYIGEVYYLTFDPTLKWFYLGGQTPKEAFLFVSFDSSFDGGEIGESVFRIVNRAKTEETTSIATRITMLTGNSDALQAST